MKFILIAGIIVTFLGNAILAGNAFSNSLNVWIIGSIKERLHKPITAIVGFVIAAIGFGLLLWAALS